MKKVIFSFDDGLLDFYYNVFPILKKYNITATLNVITGFSDNTVESDYKCCSVEKLKELLDYGIEIANHSNDHIFPEPIQGYDLAQKKLTEWFPGYKISGIVTPYTQQPPSNYYKWCVDHGIKYIRLGDTGCKNSFYRMLVKIGFISNSRIYCMTNSRYEKRGKIKLIYSHPIMANKGVDYYQKIIELSVFNPKITFMFHSIFYSEDEFKSCPYPDGAWTTGKFESLIKWILEKGYIICRQCDTV